MAFVGKHQLAPFPSPVQGVDLLSLPIFVRGNDNAIAINFNAHDADGSIHLGSGSTATISASNVTSGVFPGSYTVAGSFTTSGVFVASSAATIGGPLTASSTVTVAGLFTASSSATVGKGLAVSSSATIGGSLVVSGPFTASSAATVSGLFTASSSATVGGALTVTGLLTPNGGIAGGGIPVFVPVSSCANSVPTATGIVVTVPNTSAGGVLRLDIAAQSGASTFAPSGGEATLAFSVIIPIARTAGTGVNSAGVGTAGFGSNTSFVTGSSAGPLTVSVGAVVSGGTSATQTVSITIDITRNGGDSTNHTAQILAQWIPGVVAGGITVAY